MFRKKGVWILRFPAQRKGGVKSSSSEGLKPACQGLKGMQGR